MKHEIKVKLKALQDKEYQAFQSRIIPTANNIIGVRTPELRKLAKQIMKEDYLTYLKNASDDSYEEIILQGMVIGYSKLSFEEIKPYIIGYIPKISNWAICDQFVSNLKVTKTNMHKMYVLLQPFLKSEKTFEVRFGVVMLLHYYLNEEYCEKAFAYFDNIKVKEYYVQMAIAWAISTYYVKCKEKTMLYLLHNHLDDFTYNKALSKIIDSLQIDKEEKMMIKAMKRKNQA